MNLSILSNFDSIWVSCTSRNMICYIPYAQYFGNSDILSHDAFRVIIRASIYRVYMYVYENVMILELFCFILFYTIEVSFPLHTMVKKKKKKIKLFLLRSYLFFLFPIKNKYNSLEDLSISFFLSFFLRYEIYFFVILRKNLCIRLIIISISRNLLGIFFFLLTTSI